MTKIYRIIGNIGCQYAVIINGKNYKIIKINNPKNVNDLNPIPVISGTFKKIFVKNKMQIYVYSILLILKSGINLLINDKIIKFRSINPIKSFNDNKGFSYAKDKYYTYFLKFMMRSYSKKIITKDPYAHAFSNLKECDTYGYYPYLLLFGVKYKILVWL